jgi:hypothetical protein
METVKPLEISKLQSSGRWKMPKPKISKRHSLLGKPAAKNSNPTTLSNHRRMIFTRAHRMGISIEDYLKLCKGEVIETKETENGHE